MSEPLIPRHGGYRNLKSFQVAQLVYDVTVHFVERYIDPRSRMRDQMVQAARSGTQNIAEGSVASGTSKKMELKLTNVARASLEELRLDYEDFLRHRSLPVWGRNDPRRQRFIDLRPASVEAVEAWVRRVVTKLSPSVESTQSTPSTETTESEALANGALALIAVASALLSRQVQAQAAAFEQDGGFTERLYRTRRQRRDGK
ncbi:MAG: four helix bundle suffix domain-containing protein [Fimbriimonadaceae bacterium]|nr:four helix bundle protein [Fimbriimonadaceae bacterium]MCL4284411.1 four helix bundle suffix domain-containing protein [Fimbriimonadaceae bacterium]QOJ12214.1 MAG: four helix bundle protein [Chthonomonadaceae bacterium]